MLGCVERVNAFVFRIGVVFLQAEGGMRDADVTGVQTCALPISAPRSSGGSAARIAGLAGFVSYLAVRFAFFRRAMAVIRAALPPELRGAEVFVTAPPVEFLRSEKGRAGEEWRSRGWPYH